MTEQAASRLELDWKKLSFDGSDAKFRCTHHPLPLNPVEGLMNGEGKFVQFV